MDRDMDKYETFENEMKGKFPEMFSKPYGGFAVGEGWWPILKELCSQINSYTKWRNGTRESLLKDNPYDHEIPDAIPQVVIAQVKEKFGGLRFYYDGGDSHISGMVRMAEIWAGHTCETCGKPGTIRHGGWIRTLCDEHEEERQQQMKERFAK
jgi:hypothetical protein